MSGIVIDDLLQAIKAASTNPLALTAYLMTVCAWCLSVWRIRRHSILLKHIKDLPSQDRIKALQMEMDHVNVPSGLSAEEYLRSKSISYIFYAFIAICITLVVVVSISFYKYEEITGNITLWG